MENVGTIFNIQKFSVHDGPGIRTTVFFKGCPLTCTWCSNPESQRAAPQLMIRDIKCAKCGACIEACPEKAISLSDKGDREIFWDKCSQCFECVNACIYGSLSVIGEKMTARAVLDEVEKDRVFYKNSGGGVTLSGGEPLMQYRFLEELLPLLKKADLHVAMDTTGHAPTEIIEKIIPNVDLVLFDIKHLDSRLHKEFTGVGNKLILKNAKKISAIARTWFRIPLIKGFNDSISLFQELVAFAKQCHVEKISLLPYHSGGVSKRSQIGLPNNEYTAVPPDENHIEDLIKYISQEEIAVELGR